MKKFERSIKGIICCSTSLLIIFYALVFLFYTANNCNWFSWDNAQNKIFFQMCFTFIIFLLAQFFLRPDFKYCINVSNNCIIFEFSKDDHRRINRNFTIESKTRNYLVLDDSISRIKIGYNKKVLKFLEEINN